MTTKITKTKVGGTLPRYSKIGRESTDEIAYRPRVILTPGDAVRIARELHEMTQVDLAEAAGMPQATISAIERGRVTLGAERAEKLARALKVHPAVLLWPQWSGESEAKRVG